MGAAIVVYATRGGLRLSPDSITYLSVADHLRGGHGFTDFTGEPLTVFGPVQPLLLAPGGRSEVWASLVGAACVAASVVLMWALLRPRVRPSVAIGAAAALGLSHTLVVVASSAFSEAPYLALSLAVLVVLAEARTTRRCALGGALAGLAFLARYAGAGVALTGMVMVVWAARSHGARTTARHLAAYTGTAGAVAATWVVRNLVVSGQPLGPRFEGGTTEEAWVLLRRPFVALGQVLLGESLTTTRAAWTGGLVLAALAAVAVWSMRRGRPSAAGVGVGAFAVTSFVVPVVARALTANDISSRVMSPMLIALVYAAALVASAWSTSRVWAGAAVVAGAAWAVAGVATAEHVPSLPSSGSRTVFSAALHDAVDGLDADAGVLTNNPWGVWWQNEREPTLFAFTRPRPGNSHFPLSDAETLALACTQPTYLAWFSGLRNAGDGPEERRPALLELVELDTVTDVAGGELYRLTPIDPASCDAALTG